MAEKEAKKSSYDASDITVLEGLEAVRRRPGMYIGTTGTDGLHHLMWEIFDNSRDEAMGGFCDDIEVALLPGGSRARCRQRPRHSRRDHPKTKVSALETVMTMLHAGGKFGGEGYKVSGGLHGVGASVVNALSDVHACRSASRRRQYVQEYKNGGKPVGKIKKWAHRSSTAPSSRSSPTRSIFPDCESELGHDRRAHAPAGISRKGFAHLYPRSAQCWQEVDDDSVFYLRELKHRRAVRHLLFRRRPPLARLIPEPPPQNPSTRRFSTSRKSKTACRSKSRSNTSTTSPRAFRLLPTTSTTRKAART